MRAIDLEGLRTYMTEPQPELDKRLFLLAADAQAGMNYRCCLIGGKLARPEVYGLSHGIRKSSNDIDVLVESRDSIPKIEGYGELFYIDEWDGYALVPESRDICVSLHTEKTHDWKPPEDFWKSTRMSEVYGKALRVPSPEWAIATKMLTNVLNRRMRRKDSIDVSAIILSMPYDPEKLQEIMARYVCSQCDHGSLLCLSEMQSARRHMKNSMQETFEGAYLHLQNTAEDICHDV